MANPKNRNSRTRRDMRRAASWRLALPSLGVCPQCHGAKLPHHICPHCGYYRGREALKVKKEEK